MFFMIGLLKFCLRKYPNIFKNYVNINENEIDNLIKSTNQNIREIFSRLDQKRCNKLPTKSFRYYFKIYTTEKRRKIFRIYSIKY